MKKFVSLILIMMMVISAGILASCGSSETPTTTPASTTAAASTTPAKTDTPAPTTTPVQTTPTPVDPLAGLNAAIEKTKALTSYNAALTLVSKVTAGETVTTTTADYTVAVDGTTAKGGRTVKVGELEATVEVYQADGTIYVKKGEEKSKGSAISADYKDYDLTKLVAPMISTIPEALLAAGKTEVKDGATVASFDLTADQLAATFPEFAASMATAVAGAQATDYAISAAKVEVTFGEYVTAYNVSFTVTLKVDGAARTGEVSLALTFVKPGEKASITAPADLADYK